MMFVVQACDSKGAKQRVEIEASAPGEAQTLAKARGLFVVSVTQQIASKQGADNGEVPKRIRGCGKKITQFARELSVLVGTSTPIAESLRAIEKQAGDTSWKRVIRAVRESVEEGSSLSSSLSAHPGVFDPVFCSLIAAGESSGRLDDLLKRLAQMKRREHKAKSLIVGSATYPAVLVVVSSGVMVAMMLFVIPRFAGLFETLNAPLPWTTAMLLAISDGVKQWWWGALIVAALCGVGVCLSARSDRAKRHADRVLCHIPVMGPMAQGFTMARMLRLLGVLLDAHVSMLESLQLVRKSVRRPLYNEWADRATELVTRGEPLSGSFEDELLFPPSIREAISNGERTGRLAPVLIDVSDFLDDENEASARTFANLLEPLIMVVLGAVVAFVALSMFIPLFDLTASVGGGG